MRKKINIKISVLIVSHNSGEYIKNTIKSVLSQSHSHFEILILDNNSIDNTIINIESFNDSRIKIFKHKTNIGPYKGLNFLLENATGQYIAIQDHDDIWHGEKLERQLKFLESNKHYIGCGTETIMYYENNKTFFRYYLSEENYYTVHPSLLFRYNENFKYDERLIYFGDAYSQKINLCEGKKLIYNIKTPLTLHIIKGGYSNFTYSWFKLNVNYILRIFDVHDFTMYSFFILFYEVFRKLLLLFLKIFNNQKIFIFFDRLPYKLSGNKIELLALSKNKYITDMRDKYL